MTMILFLDARKAPKLRLRRKWEDSDAHYLWLLHQGKNHLEMRTKSKCGIYGHPSSIECNYVAKLILKPVQIGSMND